MREKIGGHINWVEKFTKNKNVSSYLEQTKNKSMTFYSDRKNTRKEYTGPPLILRVISSMIYASISKNVSSLCIIIQTCYSLLKKFHFL